MEQFEMKKGFVALVGAGAGDAGLLTMRGSEYISRAEVVVFDRLVSAEILALIPPSAELIDVGKVSSYHKVKQDDINLILLEQAQRGKLVVRLKGGDPFVFGRGGEELELLHEHGIPFEVVPGITSAIAVPAHAGIPVTHRDFCSSIHIVTAHQKENEPLKINFQALKETKGTLVFLMGVSAAPEIVAGLLGAGMSGDTPAAVIENGARCKQRKLITTLAELPEQAQQHKIKSPSVIIVGEVCSLSDKYDWFSTRSLFGMDVVVTRADDKKGSLSGKLKELGACVHTVPCVSIQSLIEEPEVVQELKNIHAYQWLVFTSAKGVELFFGYLRSNKVDFRQLANFKFAVVGSQTAARLYQEGIVADCVPELFDGEHLAQSLLQVVAPQEKVLLLRAAQGADTLPQILRAGGLSVQEVHIYNTLPNTAGAEQLADLSNRLDRLYVTFTSASTVEGFVRSLPSFERAKVYGICIGEQTARMAQQYGIEHCVSEQATMDSMIAKIKEIYDENKSTSFAGK